MISSSIRFSLVGVQVGWTTKMSRARTFSLDLDVDLAVGEAPDLRLAEPDRQVRGDVLRERAVGVAGEEARC